MLFIPWERKCNPFSLFIYKSENESQCGSFSDFIVFPNQVDLFCKFHFVEEPLCMTNLFDNEKEVADVEEKKKEKIWALMTGLPELPPDV